MPAGDDPVACNRDGLEFFAAGDPSAAEALLQKAFKGLPQEKGILVNLGLALMQQSKVDQAERCYRLALRSDELQVRRSAAKNLCRAEPRADRVSVHPAAETLVVDPLPARVDGKRRLQRYSRLVRY